MKKLLLFLLSLSTLSSVSTQPPPDFSIVSSNTCSFPDDPLWQDCDNTPWTIANGTPQIIPTVKPFFHLIATRGLTFCLDENGNEVPGTRSTGPESEGVIFLHDFKKGKGYLLTGEMRVKNFPDNIAIILANGLDTNVENNGSGPVAPPCDNPPPGVDSRSFDPIPIGSDYHVIFEKGTASGSFQTLGDTLVPFYACFKPKEDYSQIWFRIQDNDIQLETNATNIEDAAYWDFGELILETFEDNETIITYNRTEDHYGNAPYFSHRMLPPVTVAQEIVLEPQAPFGINVIENDEPVTLVGWDEVRITAIDTAFEFTMEPFLDPNVDERFVMKVTNDPEEFYSYNDCDNYFSAPQMKIMNEADFVGGFWYDSLSNLRFGNEIASYDSISYVYNDNCQRCLVVPAVFIPLSDLPYYGVWEPWVVGYPKELNACEYHLIVETTTFALLHEEEGAICVKDSLHMLYGEEGDVLPGNASGGNHQTVSVSVELTNCTGKKNFDMNVLLDWNGREASSIPDDSFFKKRWNERGSEINQPSFTNEVDFERELSSFDFGPPIVAPGISQKVEEVLKTTAGGMVAGKDIVGTEVGKEYQMNIRPNPTRSKLSVRVKSEEPSTFATIGIYSITGEKIIDLGQQYLSNGTVIEVNLTGYSISPGVYLCKVKTPYDIFSEKFIVY